MDGAPTLSQTARKDGEPGHRPMISVGLKAGELGDVGGGDFGLEDWGVCPDVADLSGCDFILGDLAGLAGTGIYQGLRTGLELACASCGDHYVAKIAIELLLDTHSVSPKVALAGSHRSSLGVDDSESLEHGFDACFRVSLTAFFRLCDQLFIVGRL